MRTLSALDKISYSIRAALVLHLVLFSSFNAWGEALNGGTQDNPTTITSASDLSGGLGSGYYSVSEDVTCSSRIIVT